MRIALRALATVCVLWAVLVPMLPTELPPPIGLWWWGATKEAEDVLARTNAPVIIGATNKVEISRSSLHLLAMRAKEPLRQQNLARGFLWASSVFALGAGISLFLLSRRQTRVTTTPA